MTLEIHSFKKETAAGQIHINKYLLLVYENCDRTVFHFFRFIYWFLLLYI